MEKLELWTKVGKVFNESKNNSIGLQLGYLDHDADNQYGTKGYSSTHESIYANLIYQTNLITPENSVKVGLSYLRDDITEQLTQNVFETYDDTYSRFEETPGAFLEYTWQPGEKLTAVAGARLDHHNQYGYIFTPRLHFRWARSENSVLRLIGGKGWRTASPLAENPGIFASNRFIHIRGNDESDTPYGLQREQSWNFGGNLTQTLPFRRKATLSLDYYYTVFDNQILADFESNLQGFIIVNNQLRTSSGHSAQAQFDVELFKNFDVRLAYRYNDNKAFYGTELLTTPYNPYHKAFVNLAYETQSKWYFDLTVNWRSSQRLPDTTWLGDGFDIDGNAPSYYLANAQIRKFLTDDFEMYLGCENILNYTQDDPIIDADNPFSRNFDASYVYAPIFGRNVYAGLRYKLPYN
jgi:outer membrane receptor for ferrienterochelin and colicin